MICNRNSMKEEIRRKTIRNEKIRREFKDIYYLHKKYEILYMCVNRLCMCVMSFSCHHKFLALTLVAALCSKLCHMKERDVF
jgi:hypothetical protein